VVTGGDILSDLTDRAEYEKYRAEMLQKLRQSQEARAEGQCDTSEKTAGRPKKTRHNPGAVVTIASLSFVVFGLVVLLLFLFAMTPPADKTHSFRTPWTGIRNTEKSAQEVTARGEIAVGGADEGEVRTAQAAPWELGFEKGREIAGVFLTNKQRLKEERCSEAMRRIRTSSEDYLKGCLEGYDSLVMEEDRSR
jgi:septin family protein